MLQEHRRIIGATEGLNVLFPYTKKEVRAYKSSSKALAHGCSTTGKPLSRKVPTANVARDVDVMRRVVGDEQLTFLGFSYGYPVSSGAASSACSM
ncbi:hypothetical protein BH23ACT6_BH23ACT6_14890 [soil metagenome]